MCDTPALGSIFLLEYIEGSSIAEIVANNFRFGQVTRKFPLHQVWFLIDSRPQSIVGSLSHSHPKTGL